MGELSLAAAGAAISVRDSGTTGGTLLLELRADGFASLRAQMVLRVRSGGGRVVFAGPLRSVVRIRLGRIAPSEQQRLRLRVQLSRDAPDGTQGRRLALAARWLAVSAVWVLALRAARRADSEQFVRRRGGSYAM